MLKYDYHIAASLEDVTQLLLEYGDRAAVIAGGTDLMVQIHEKSRRWEKTELLIDITHLARELDYISESEDTVYIGPLATHTEIHESPLIRRELPFLSEASGTVGSPQIRNRGTIGGSIGNALPASDPLPTLVASDAEVVLLGPDGKRAVPIADLYQGKGKLKLGRGEFIREFRVKKLTPGTGTGFAKLGRRKALAISRINCAAKITKDPDGVITEAGISPGCIFLVPERTKRAEELLIGKQADYDLFEEAGRAVSQRMIEKTGVRWSTEYKQPAVEEMVYRALVMAAGLEKTW